MEYTGIKALLVVLLLAAVFAARPKCRKRLYTSRYGQQSSFQTLEGLEGTCKYKIRTSPGLHISLVLNNYFPDSSTVSIVAKRASTFTNVLIPPGPQARLTVEASRAILTVQTFASARAINITHEPVIPADGNFGYRLKVGKKPKMISTPGFPKFRLSSGTRSVWNVTCKNGGAVGIDILRLYTSSDEDFVEIFDDSESIGRYSGRRKRITARAQSGRMLIQVHTETSTSKGFKAKVFSDPSAAGRTDADSASEGSDGKVLRCHNRMKITSMGVTITDNYSRISCNNEEICGRMVVEGTSNIGGHQRQVTHEIMHCIASSQCDQECDGASQDMQGLIVTSCSLSCCVTEFCNKSPGGPDAPPLASDTTSPSMPTPPAGAALRCHSTGGTVQESAAMMSGDPGQSSVLCNTGEVCALYKFLGTATEPHHMTEPMWRYSAMCQPLADCNEQACMALSLANNVQVTSCEAKCCTTDMCNDPGETSVLSTQGPPQRLCYDVLQAGMGDSYFLNNMTLTSCGAGYTCARFEAYATMNGLDVAVVYGACFPEQACSALTCDVLSAVLPGITLKDCRSGCCHSDECNNQPIPTTNATGIVSSSTMSPVGGSSNAIQCHDRMQMKGIGMTLPGSKNDVVTCPPGSRCMSMTAKASLASLPAGMKVTIDIGSCAFPGTTCDSKSCSSYMSRMDGLTIETCDTSCCDGNFCNA